MYIERENKAKKNDEMVSFRKLSSVCLFFVVFQEAKTCHKVPIKLVSVKLVYSLYFLKRFAIRACNEYACNAISARSQTLSQ